MSRPIGVWAGPLEVGRYYRVPTVEGRIYDRLERWPVIGPLHEDRDVISFPWLHYHLDFRFLSSRLLRYLSVRCARVEGLVLSDRAGPPLGPIVVRRRKCRRLCLGHCQGAPWQRELERAYAGRTINPDRPVCPHKGADLSGIPARDGVIVCPLHGLGWCARTGRLVTAGETWQRPTAGGGPSSSDQGKTAGPAPA